MSKSKPRARVKLIKGKNAQTELMKAVSSTSIEDDKDAELSGIEGLINPPFPIKELQEMVERSTILEQCVEAYRRNIVGFGAVPEYKEDIAVQEESPEMETELELVQDFIDFFSFDTSFEDVFGDAIEDREITGNGYIEVIRDGQGLPREGHRLDPAYIYTTKLGDFVDVETTFGSETFSRKRKFRKYIQDIGTKKVYYKEYGDPRIMDNRTGEYVNGGLSEEYQANEVLHLKIGKKAYGVPRWIGQLIHIAGARLAEELNYRYFTQGRHTPMAILLHNAVLSPESEQQLEEYAQSVEGVDNSHKFLVIEAEGLDEGILEESKKNAKVEMTTLADMLQQDALFLDYDESSRQKVQSAFRLPDIYVGRSKDFNRATADTARTITEEQVFEPERNSLEWVINNKLINEFGISHVRIEFNKPEISNADEIVDVLNAGNNLKALAPNDVRPIIGALLGVELEPFEGDEYNLPAGESQQAQTPLLSAGQTPHDSNTPDDEEEQEDEADLIDKAYKQTDLISLLKDMRDVIEEMNDKNE